MNRVVHSEIHAADPERAASFYRDIMTRRVDPIDHGRSDLAGRQARLLERRRCPEHARVSPWRIGPSHGDSPTAARRGFGVMTMRFWPALLITFASMVAAQERDVPFRTSATPWDTEALGNHRAVVRVDSAAPAVRVVVPWRRRDAGAARGNIIVTDASGKRLPNVVRGRVNSDFGELWFGPDSGPGRYFVYYLPYKTSGRRNYPTVEYPAFESTASPAWLAELKSGAPPDVVVEAIESVDPFNSFSPMETAATEAEVGGLRAANPGAAFLVFPEERAYPVRMFDRIPARWMQKGAGGPVQGTARPGEYFAFQIGVLAIRPLENVAVRFTDLIGPAGKTVPASKIDCIHTHGVGWDGKPFTRRLDIPPGAVQPLWCGIDVPQTTVPGDYVGRAAVGARGRPSTEVRIELKLLGTVAVDGGANEPWNQTRLKWLNSTMAQRNDVIPPYTPLRVRGNDIALLGRTVSLGTTGLPARIRTYFTPEVTRIADTANEVLGAPVDLVAGLGGGRRVAWRPRRLRFVETSPGTARWQGGATSAELECVVDGSLEFDGFAAFSVAVTARRDLKLDDIRLEIPYAPGAATYMMGLGQKGGVRPEKLEWKWDVASKNQDGAWLGGVNAGLAFSLRAENYSRPLNTNFYLQKPLLLPPSWGNGGLGRITVSSNRGAVLVAASGGPRELKAGQTLHFDFTLLITPFHTLDTKFQWSARFFHRYDSVDAIRKTGATVINVHHATPINPWINYPFIAHREMKAYIDEAHAKGLRVKIYNTVRELSNRAWELFPLRSLGHEIFSPGPGGGFSWLQEHLGGDYIAAWFVPELRDAAIINSGMSRWHNYYVEGMNWLVDQVGIDGIYLDDVAFDRTTMKRIKRVLTRDGHPGIIDLHSANQFNPRDGFVNSALLYMEHFPYLNRLWFGEYFDYEKNPPDFYLTEVSGIPFGLMGEMLEGGGNPWRGMVYGMTNRLPWSDKSDPRPIWKAWDRFGIAESEMIGYWSPHCPVRTGRSDVPATVFRKQGSALIALASWAGSDVSVPLSIDWRSLGMDQARASISAPEIADFQPARTFRIDEPIPVSPGRGWMLLISESQDSRSEVQPQQFRP